MNPAWSVLDSHIVFTQQVQPPTLLAYWFRRRHEIRQGCMVSPDDYGLSKKVLPILFQAKDHPEELTTGNTVPGFCGCQCPTGIAYDMQCPLLLPLQDSPNAVSDVSVSST